MRRFLAAFLLAFALMNAPLMAVLPQGAVPPQSQTAGNPEAQVWVNTKSRVYHCAGTRWYGTTKQGAYMTQKEAQEKGNRPAYGKACK